MAQREASHTARVVNFRKPRYKVTLAGTKSKGMVSFLREHLIGYFTGLINTSGAALTDAGRLYQPAVSEAGSSGMQR